MRLPWDANCRLVSQSHALCRNNVNHKSPQILTCVYDDDDGDDDNDNNNNNKY